MKPATNETTTRTDARVLNAQQAHWQATFASRPEMFGALRSQAAAQASEQFRKEGRRRILELGCGQGRDTLFFIGAGFEVMALDYSEQGIEELRAKAAEGGAGSHLTAAVHDIRRPLPFADCSFDASFSHMLYCMALTTAELEGLCAEIRRVLRPGGLNVYTARNTKDPDFGTGTHRGEQLYELDGGFVVHFFGRALVERLAQGWQSLAVEEFEEGPLPKRLFLVRQRKDS